MSLIDDIIHNLTESQLSMSKQTVIINEIMEKSNAALIQIEAAQRHRSQTESATSYTCNAESFEALSKIILEFQKLYEHKQNTETKTRNNATKMEMAAFKKFCQMNRQYLKLLNSGAWKLTALGEFVEQMKAEIEYHDEEENQETQLHNSSENDTFASPPDIDFKENN